MIKCFLEYLRFKWLIIGFRIAGASKDQVNLEKGKYYLRKGARFSVGQQVVLNRFGNRKKRYIANLYYNFKDNKITASYSNRPIKGITKTP